MCKVAAEYHQSLQKAPERQNNDNQSINETLRNITNKLREEDQHKLNQPTNEYEIKKAIRESQNGKAPRFNGIPYKFYKEWIKEYKDFKDSERSRNPKKPIANIAKILKEIYNEIEEEGLKD